MLKFILTCEMDSSTGYQILSLSHGSRASSEQVPPFSYVIILMITCIRHIASYLWKNPFFGFDPQHHRGE
jgi:hypothetical protein